VQDRNWTWKARQQQRQQQQGQEQKKYFETTRKNYIGLLEEGKGYISAETNMTNILCNLFTTKQI
jgi:hypothetical protein